MLKKMEDLPSGIDGFEATGTLSKEDYETVLRPFLEKAHQENRKLRFLYQLGQSFEKFSPGAAWDDFHLGFKYLRLFERCALVSDKDWILATGALMAPLFPRPFKSFPESEFKAALAWLQAPNRVSHLQPQLFTEKELLLVNVTGPLEREDFDQLAALVDPWLEHHHKLRGLVVQAQQFPGWENLGSLWRHLEFVREHHKKVSRVAIVVDGNIPEIVARFASHFVDAQVQHFAYADSEKAMEWAATKNHA